MVQVILNAPVSADRLSQDLGRISVGAEVTGGLFLARNPVLPDGVEARGLAGDLDHGAKRRVPGLDANARGQAPEAHGALLQPGALAQVTLVMLIVRRVLGAVGANGLL